MPRPKGIKNKPLGVLIPPEHRAALDQLVERKNAAAGHKTTNRNREITIAIAEYLKKEENKP